MKAFTTATAVEPPITSNRRQPLRQTRTNPSRSATRPLVGRGSLNGPVDGGGNASSAHSFFPAITHFTDSITALPKEMIRHYTMLKEIDAKIYGPEDALKQLVTTVLNTPLPQARKPPTRTKIEANPNFATCKNKDDSINGPEAQRHVPDGETVLQTENVGQDGSADLARRNLFLQLRIVMSEMLMTLDEKNHVMSTATDALDKQLARCDSSYPSIENEISEEARYGNLHHWAYMEKTAEKKGTTAGERTRRDAAGAAAAAAALHEEVAAIRSEARREAMAARKLHNKHNDSDFDESRGTGHIATKKSVGAAKGRKAAEPMTVINGHTSGLGIISGSTGQGTSGPNKRRKVEKTNFIGGIGGLPMEKSLSAVYGPIAGNNRGRASSPKETPVAEARKTKGRGGTAINGSGRRRANTNASAINSPSLASSPVVSTFAVAARVGNSPIPSATQRTQSSRVRKNSTQSVVQEASRIRPTSSASNKPMNGNGLHGTLVDINRATGTFGKSMEDIKITTRESTLSGEKPTDETGCGESDQRGDLSVSKRGSEKFVKREDYENGGARSRVERPPSISTSTRGGGKASKTATPVSGSFPEPQRPRSGRAAEVTIKRSHKKGAGLAAQLAAQAAAAEEEGSSLHGDDEEDDDTEPTYCYCDGVSYGEMVACDNEGCKREWFHLECAGLTKPPSKNSKSIQKNMMMQIAKAGLQRNGTVGTVKKAVGKAACLGVGESEGWRELKRTG